MNSKTMSRVLPLLAVALLISISSAWAASDYTWVDSPPLKWASNGLTTKTFTASVMDTDSFFLPSDIAEELANIPSAAGYPFMTLKFTSTTAASGADSVHFLILPCGMGVCAQGDPTAISPVIGVVAVNAGPTTANGGRLMIGPIVRHPTSVGIALAYQTWGAAAGARVKVCGDPNGAFTALKVCVHYPRRVK